MSKDTRWVISGGELEGLLQHTEDTLEAYRPGHSEGDGPELAISDLLADLMHFCKADKIDFSRCLARAQDHFKEETEDANDK